MERKQGLMGGFLGQKGEDGSEGRDASSDATEGSEAGSSPAKGKQVDAYEEDWYRSLKALAERRAQIAEEDEEEAPAAPEPPEQPAAQIPEPPAVEGHKQPAAEIPEPPAVEELEQPAAEIAEPPAVEELEQPAAEIPEPPAVEELEQPAAEIPEPPAVEELEQPAASVPEPSDQPAAVEPEVVEALGPDAPYSPEPVEPARAGAAESSEPAEAVEAVEAVAHWETEFAPIQAYGAPPEAALEAEPEAGASLTARDPDERRLALRELAERGPGDGELEQVAGLLLDPDREVRRLALEVLSSRADRIDDATIKQALMDPADEVRATAVRLAAERGSRDLVLLAPLVAARRWPLTQAAVLDLRDGFPPHDGRRPIDRQAEPGRRHIAAGRQPVAARRPASGGRPDSGGGRRGSGDPPRARHAGLGPPGRDPRSCGSRRRRHRPNRRVSGRRIGALRRRAPCSRGGRTHRVTRPLVARCGRGGSLPGTVEPGGSGAKPCPRVGP